jgi:hypothetical protein
MRTGRDALLRLLGSDGCELDGALGAFRLGLWLRDDGLLASLADEIGLSLLNRATLFSGGNMAGQPVRVIR